MVSGGGSEKSGGGGGSHSVAKTDGTKEYPLPEGQLEVKPYAFKGYMAPDKKGFEFWNPAPKDMPEPPVHFQKNAVNLELHLGDPRQRLAGMTPAERDWRKKFMLDQHLSADEPRYVPAIWGNFNPFRRIYRIPWDTLEKRVLIPSLGFTYGHYLRVYIPKMIIFSIGFMWFFYHLKYHHPYWFDRTRTSMMRENLPLVHEKEIREKYPGLIEKGFRNFQDKQDFYNLSFKQRYTHLQLDPPLRP